MSDSSAKFKFNSQTDKVLHMVINSIYTKKEVFLRELISNSIDAIEKRKYLSITENESLAVDNNEYKITVDLDKKNRTISITDNGIGMDKEEVIDNLGTIAKSGTEDFSKNTEKKDALIGQFGVGFYSSFIVGSKVKVVTKKAGTDKGYTWESDGITGYTVKDCLDPCKEGTVITISLKEDMDEFLDKFRVKFIIDSYSSSSNVPIEIVSGTEIEKISSKLPIWTRDKKTISEDEYNNFYKTVSHLPDKPSVVIHYNAEGTIEFKSLLFIPSMKPFDLFHPDRRTRVKLYSRKVFITEDQVEILPKYLRFVYGVVESDSIPLNISRETIQVYGETEKIGSILVKKIYNELEACRLQRPDDYLSLWSNFGNVIKEGLCENNTDKVTILNNCLFYTTKNLEKPIPLSQYIDGLANDNKEIYYCLGDSIESVLLNPQLEIFAKKDIEVLLLVDPVDSFWINVVHSHDGYQFKSISRASTHVMDDKEEDKEGKDSQEINKDEMVTLFTKALKDKVKEIKISDKLTESPACISVADGSMDIAMERFLIEQNQVKGPSLKILEINPNNKIIQYIVGSLKDEKTYSTGEQWANLILDTACIAQGDVIKNTGAFAKRLNTLLGGVLPKN